jgi:hypothetical protein
MACDQDPLAEAILPTQQEQTRALVALQEHRAGLSGVLPITGLRRPQGRPAQGTSSCRRAATADDDDGAMMPTVNQPQAPNRRKSSSRSRRA